MEAFVIVTGAQGVAPPVVDVMKSARSSIGLEQLTSDQQVGGSSPPGRAYTATAASVEWIAIDHPPVFRGRVEP